MNFKEFLMLAVLGASLTGCASGGRQVADLGENIIIAEPVEVSRQTELSIARLTEIINRVEIEEQQKARLYYERGLNYDRAGLHNLARFDFTMAIRLDQNMSEAYNFMGIHMTQKQEFYSAFEAFDSAIDLAPDNRFAYLNRGIALYYGERPELAKTDLEYFLKFDVADPYRIVWLYFVDLEIDEQTAIANLKKNSEQLNHSEWGAQIVKLYLNEIDEQEFIAGISQGVRDRKELVERLCEGYFYLGKYYLHKKQKRKAMNFFKLALTTNIFDFVEHRYAKLELDLLRLQLKEERLKLEQNQS